MTGIEVVLILIGLAFIIVSFFITEKLSTRDMEQIASLNEKEMDILVEKSLSGAKQKIEASLEETTQDYVDKANRDLEKSTNEKIMGISEFSDTVMDSMNKTHEEIVFLYSMLGDKHKELTSLTSEITDKVENGNRIVRRLDQEEYLGSKAPGTDSSEFLAFQAEAEQSMKEARGKENLAGAEGQKPAPKPNAADLIEEKLAALEQKHAINSATAMTRSGDQSIDKSLDFDGEKSGSDQMKNTGEAGSSGRLDSSDSSAISQELAKEASQTKRPSDNSPIEKESNNRNRQVLQLKKEGLSEVEIAKKLNMGLGEIRLILGLYRGNGR